MAAQLDGEELVSFSVREDTSDGDLDGSDDELDILTYFALDSDASSFIMKRVSPQSPSCSRESPWANLEVTRLHRDARSSTLLGFGMESGMCSRKLLTRAIFLAPSTYRPVAWFVRSLTARTR